MQSICRSAADMVIAVQSRGETSGTEILDTVISSVDVRGKVVVLADMLYSSEELYAMQICFDPHLESSRWGECATRLAGRDEREVYDSVARFIASLVPPAAYGAAGDGTDALAEAAPGQAFCALAGALRKAGYLSALVD